MNYDEKNVSRFGVQRKIVANMTSESWRSIPHVSYIFEPDLTDFIVKLKEFNDELAKDGKHVTFNTVMMKAICEAIKEAPQLNAHINFEQKLVRGKTIRFENIDVSTPYLLPDGRMMTINMHDMGNRSLGNITDYMADIARKIKNSNLDEAMYSVSINDTWEKLRKGHIIQVAQRLYGSFTNPKHKVRTLKGKAKKEYDAIPDKDKLTVDDLRQGTITISNIGSLTRGHDGHIGLIMIIPPQVCAIGVGALEKKPVVETDENGEDKIIIKQTCPLDICFDHRVLDFGEVKPFLDALQKIFDDPEKILVY